jgi:hypothetical protein
LWGSASKKYLYPITVAQKQAIRIIANAPKLSHSAPLAKELNILFVNDVYKLHLAYLMFNVNCNNAHCVFINNIQKVYTAHLHYTRSSVNKFFVPVVHKNVCKNFVFYQGIIGILWNALPLCITNCKTFNAFKRHMLIWLFNNYI